MPLHTVWVATGKTLSARKTAKPLVLLHSRDQLGGGKHICDCGYMTSAAATGRGVGRAMCQHSLDYARQRGYHGMQFNFVVSTDTRAVAIWESPGFEIVGRLPQALHH